MSNGEIQDSKRKRMKEQHPKWNGTERRRPDLKWARVMTDEVRKLKYQVNSVESMVFYLHKQLKPKGEDDA